MSVGFVVDKRHGASAADSLVSVSSTSAPSRLHIVRLVYNGPIMDLIYPQTTGGKQQNNSRSVTS